MTLMSDYPADEKIRSMYPHPAPSTDEIATLEMEIFKAVIEQARRNQK